MRTAEHIVESHQIRRDRIKRGLSAWEHTIQLGHVFHNESLTFIQRRDAIVDILKRSKWVNLANSVSLEDCIDCLGQSVDAEEFDQYWEELYDYADLDSVWIATHPVPEGCER